ncbi:MAG TPA: non-homologous end-joining DNA ligase, partial [Anaerolineae bacterium]|nr:non-homologous end-joining DNA ligase [Anaerolineae bacterium]
VVCRVAFASWTEAGLLRQASFLGLVEDRDPRTVTREQEGRMADAKPKRRKAGKKVADDTVDAGGREVPVSSLDKVYWPDDGLTKGDMIDYYCDMADLVLPYVVDRPMTLVRFPSGIEGDSFYQKDIDYAPDWIETYSVPSKSKGDPVDYLLCQDAASLIWMANLGSIPLNPWNSRIHKPDHPDYLVIDLDPLDVSFADVVRVALVVREVLESVELTHVCKTSGSTGLHIFVPLGARYSYEQTEQFGTLIGHLVQARLPDITSLARSPKDRKGKVYLDMLQNRRGQTLTAPYSLRARPGAPVSTPLRWEEVTAELDPRDLHLRNTRERVDELGDLWRPVLGPGIDMEAALDALTELWEGSK